MVKPVADKYFMTDAELEAERRLAHEAAARSASEADRAKKIDSEPTKPWIVIAAWLVVGVPLAWGVLTTLQKAWVLFQ
jgi:hypothetical protein